PIISGDIRVAGVLDHDKTMPSSNTPNRIHVGRMSVEVYRNNRFGARRNRTFQLRGVHSVGLGIDIHQDGSSATIGNSKSGGDKGIGGSYSFVSRANAVGSQC